MILKEFSPDLSALTAQHMSNLAKLMFHFDFENSRVRIHVSLVWSAGLWQLKQKKKNDLAFNGETKVSSSGSFSRSHCNTCGSKAPEALD